jgi:hypothetical protein
MSDVNFKTVVVWIRGDTPLILCKATATGDPGPMNCGSCESIANCNRPPAIRLHFPRYDLHADRKVFGTFTVLGVKGEEVSVERSGR